MFHWSCREKKKLKKNSGMGEEGRDKSWMSSERHLAALPSDLVSPAPESLCGVVHGSPAWMDQH